MRLIILLILETKFGDDPKVKSPITNETKAGCCWFTLKDIWLIEVFLILGWFGIRKEFCEFLLDTFPLLREYGNISYKFSDTILSDRNESSSDSSLETISYDQQRRKENQRIQVEAVMYIDMPD